MSAKKHVVVLTGAGISAESGVQTFRDADGLWEGHNVEDVATPQAWQRNPTLVNDFYNARRKQLTTVYPNAAHLGLVELEEHFKVSIITQNVDNLHERAGSKNILHLHGELTKVRSTKNYDYQIDWEGDLTLEDKDPYGNVLRPHIVWFGEAVPLFEVACQIVSTADVLVIIGTSLQVYPAASLMYYAHADVPTYYIDPKPGIIEQKPLNFTLIQKKATEGVRELIAKLVKG